MRITTKINELDEDLRAHVSAKLERNNATDHFLTAVHYVAILRAMRDADKDAFYHAMAQFVTDDELKSAKEWLDNEL